jgi:hypothetical protein
MFSLTVSTSNSLVMVVAPVEQFPPDSVNSDFSILRAIEFASYQYGAREPGAASNACPPTPPKHRRCGPALFQGVLKQ